jgi:putative transposase
MKVSLKKICDFFEHSRQAFYKRQKNALKTFLEEQLILSEINRIRHILPKLGGRKLHLDLKNLGFKIGRDKLFDLLRRHNLLVKRSKRFSRTTYSNHWLRKYPNLIQGIPLTGPNQVFVADITYLKTVSGFVYLSLITDAFSRKIVGWNVSASLSFEGALRALKMALKTVPHPEGLIHHSDRGIQYCCHDYVKLLNDHHVLISMTEENHCYENAIAERVNGILKEEFLLNLILPPLKVAKELVKNSILTYNSLRRHMSINYKTPNEVHSCPL